jgi:hypothetical protein
MFEMRKVRERVMAKARVLREPGEDFLHEQYSTEVYRELEEVHKKVTVAGEALRSTLRSIVTANIPGKGVTVVDAERVNEALRGVEALLAEVRGLR